MVSLFEESHCSPALLKGTTYSAELYCSHFCLKNTVLNAQKHLQPSHSFMVNVLIWQFYNRNCSYSLSIAIFLELQVDICACKGDFRSCCFLQIAALSKYL